MKFFYGNILCAGGFGVRAGGGLLFAVAVLSGVCSTQGATATSGRLYPKGPVGNLNWTMSYYRNGATNATGGKSGIILEQSCLYSGQNLLVINWYVGDTIYAILRESGGAQTIHDSRTIVLSATPGANDVCLDWNANANKRQYRLEWRWCNDDGCDQMVTLHVFEENGPGHLTRGPFPVPHTVPASCVDIIEDNPFGYDANGDGKNFGVTLERSGCAKDDFERRFENAPPPTETNAPSPPDPYNNQVLDEFDGGKIGSPNGDTNRTGDQLVHDDLQALIKKVSTWDRQDVQTALLRQIVTNTAAGTNGTNFTIGQVAVVDGTGYASTAAAGFSNAIGGLLPTSLGTFTPTAFDSSWIVSASIGGRTRTLDLRPDQNPMWSAFAGWIRAILSWLSCVILVWACWCAFDEKMQQAMLFPTSKGGILGFVGTLLNFVVSVPVILALVGALASLPGILSSWNATYGLTAYFLTHIPLSSNLDGVRQAFQLVSFFIPVDVFLYHAGIYFGFRLAMLAAYYAVGVLLRWMVA